ncbi:MAG TPA: sulfite exporter TauE/SafE family protein [Terriglobia bacterium]|nr:sulfite exporter TauE/SafE family protein [Terriglobia bacterium]
MTFPQAVLLFFAALVAGALNSVAGGGSFFTFPALLITGVPPIQANATSTVAVWPGTLASVSAYRKKLPRSPRLLIPLVSASIIGGLLGAGLLLHTRQQTFLRLVPFLYFAATLLFTFGKKLFHGTRVTEQDQASWLTVGTVALCQFFTGVYGGYFGAGMGILMLAFLSFLPLGDIHALNSVKTLLASAANGMAIITFILARIILWPQGVLMLTGAILGGYGGAHFAQKTNPARVRILVVIVGFAVSIIFFWKYQ